MKRLPYFRGLVEQYFSSLSEKQKTVFLFSGILLFAVLVSLVFTSWKFFSPSSINKHSPDVLAAKDNHKTLTGEITFNVPAIFKEKVTIDGELVVNGKTLFNENVRLNNKDLDLGTGSISASNIIYSLRAGPNISITGGQNPTISASLSGVVTSLQGQTGAIAFTQGTGIGIDGLTITNTDPGSAQNIFKTIDVDGSSITAGSNNDTLELSAGTGISLTTDGKKVTITNSAPDSGSSGGGTVPTDMTPNGILYAETNSTVTSLTPGTTGYILQSNGAGTPPSWVANTSSNPPFSSITSGTNTSAAMVVGAGASLTYAGGTATSGGINANELLGGTWATPGGIGSTTANTGAFTSLSASGTVTFSGLTTGILHSNGSGVVSSSAVNLASGDVTGTLGIANGGTGVTATPTNGQLFIGNGTGYTLATLTAGAGISINNGAGAITIAASGGSGGSQWVEDANGTFYPVNSGLDVILGGTSTSSAKFGFININSGTPTASISAGSSAVYLAGDGTLQTTNNRQLSIGGNTTGDILLSPRNGAGTVTSTGTVNLAAGKTYQIGGIDVLSSTTLGSGVVNSSLTSVGALNSGSIASGFGTIATANTITGTTINGTTGINTGAGAGTQRIDASGNLVNIGTITAGGLITANGGLTVANGQNTTLSSFTTNNNSVLYTNGSGVVNAATTATPGQCLVSNANTPAWAACPGASATNYWQLNNGAISPFSNTLDVLVGATATSSAKFGVLNVNSGTPTASLSAGAAGGTYLAANGLLQTTANQTLTIGGNTTGNIILSPQNGAGTVMSTGSVNLASGKTYQINGTDVLSGTTLGSGVINSSLTSVGALTSGSIASGFGTIATSNTITGTTLNGTTGINSGAGAGTQRIDSSGNLVNIGTIDSTYLDAAANTVNLAASTALQFNGTTVIDASRNLSNIAGVSTSLNPTAANTYNLGTGTGNQYNSIYGNTVFQNGNQVCDTSGNCAGGAGGSKWQVNAGVLAPLTTTNLLVLGGNTSTAFQFEVNGKQTGKALASLNETGNQNILTASASGTTVFNINRNGNLQFAGNTAALNTLTSAATTARTYTFPDSTGTICLVEAGNCAGSGGGITGSGTAGQIAFFNGGGSITSETSGFAWDATNNKLGIGIDSPEGKFQVNGASTGKALAIFNETGDQNILTASASGVSVFNLDRSGNLAVEGQLSDLSGTALTVNDNLNLITGNAYQINGTNVLSSTTLGTGVTGSSLTSVGTLTAGTWNATTIGAQYGGTGLNTAASTGVPTISSGTWSVSAALSAALGGTGDDTSATTGVPYIAAGNWQYEAQLNPARGGTGVNGSTAANGQLLIGNGSGFSLANITAGSGISITNGSGSITIAQNGAGSSKWTQNDATGTLNPNNTTLDVLFGGTATSSAKFGVLNMSSGTPTASLSAGAAGGSYLTANGTLQTTANQTLTLGGNTTGNIILSPQNGSGTVMSTGTINIASGKTYQINGTDVLSGTTLGTGVVNSSLTSVGALTSGSIASGFGTITTANTITGTTLNGTTGINTGVGAGTQRIDATGNLVNIGTITAGGLITANAGASITAGQNLTLAGITGNNAALYATAGTGVVAGATTNSQNLCLVSGVSAPSWQSCALGAGTNFWNSSNGALYPGNSTLDLLVGATATTSAKFGFLNVAGGTPTASISANSGANATYLTGNGTLGTTNGQTLSLGSASTGNVTLTPGGTSILTAMSNGKVGIGTTTPGATLDIQDTSTTAPSLRLFEATANEVPILELAGFAGTDDLPYAQLKFTNSNNTVNVANIKVLRTNNSSAGDITFETSPDFTGVAERMRISRLGNVGIGNSAPVGLLDVQGKVTGKALTILNETGNQNILTASASGTTKFTITNTGNLDFAGNTNFLSTLTSAATAARTWTMPDASGTVCLQNSASCGFSLGTNLWNSSNGALYPTNSTLDLLLGGTATSSAKFGLLNVAGGTPTASISANSGANATYITGAGTVGTTNAQTLTLGSSSTGSVLLAPGGTTALTAFANGNIGIGETNPLAKLHITGGELWTFNNGNNPRMLLGDTTVSGQYGYLQWDSTNDYLRIEKNGSNGLKINDNFLTIGNIFPSQPLIVANGTTELMRVNTLGQVGINAASPLATLDVRGTSGTTPVASFSGQTSSAGLIVDNKGTGDLLAASSSGLSRFVVTQTGNLQLTGNTNFLSTLTSAATAARTWTMPDASGTVCLQNSASCGFSLGNNLWNSSNGALYPSNSTMDLLVGATATTSAKFGFLNVAGGTPTASISANTTNNATYLTGDGTLGTTNKQTLTIGSASTGTIALGSSSSERLLLNGQILGGSPLVFQGATDNGFTTTINVSDPTANRIITIPNNSGTMTLNTSGSATAGTSAFVQGGQTWATTATLGTNDANSLVLRTDSTTRMTFGANNTSPTASISAQTTNAGLVIDNTSGDLFSASSSGLNRFVINQNGNVGIGRTIAQAALDVAGDIYTSSGLSTFRTAVSDGTVEATQFCVGDGETNCISDFSGAVNYWDRANGALSPKIASVHDLLLGSNATASAKFGFLNVNSGTPTASISANTTNNATYLTGDGTLGTTNRGSLTLGNSATYNTTGNVLINSNGQGKLGIGTTNPMTNLHLVASGTTLPNLSSANIAIFQRSSSAATSAGISVLGGNNSTGNFIYFSDTDDEGAGGMQYSHSTDALALRAGGANQLTIDGSGSRNHFFSNNGNHTLNVQTVSTNIAGRQLTLRGGDAGAGASDVAGGILQLQGGTGAGTNGAGGVLRLVGGVPAGAGAYGAITLAHDGTNGRGLVGVGTASPLATLDVRANSGTLPVASVAGQTSFAGLIVDNSGVGDLFTASKSGKSKFVITNGGDIRIDGNQTIDTLTAGTLGLGTANATTLTLGRSGQNIVMPTFSNNGGLLYTNGTGTVAQTAVGGNGQCLQSVGGGTPIWGSCGGSSTQWDLKNGAISPSFASTVDLLLGGVSSSSAKFGVLNINSGTPTASVSATSTGAGLALAGDGTIQSLRNNTLVIGGNTTGDIQFKPGNSSSSLYLSSTGNAGIGTTTPDTNLTVIRDSSALGTGTIGSYGFNVGQAGGGLALGDFGTYKALQSFGNTPLIINPAASNVGIGNVTSPLAMLDVRGRSGTIPVASVSGQTSSAAMIIDNRGTGDLFAASSSGLNRFVIAQNGKVGIGTTLPSAQLHISGTGTLFSAQNANSSFYTDALGVSIDRDSPSCGSEYKLLNQGTAYWKMKNSTNGCTNMGTMYFVNQNSSEILSLSQTGTLGLNTGTANPLATFDVRGNSGTTPVASVSGNTSFASMVVNNSGSGDIFTASSSGLNRFVIAQNGDVGIGKRPALDSGPTGATITSTGSAQFTSLSGAGLTDCDGQDDKLLWDAGTKKFICGTDRGSVQIRKSANETVTSSTVMQDDNELTFAVAANETWVFRVAIVSNTPATPLLKYQITAPSGASCDISTLSGSNGTAGSDGVHQGCSVAINYGGTGGVDSISEIYGSIANGANAGSITLQWAQKNSSGTGTTVYAGSSLFGFKTTGADVAEAYYTKDSSIQAGDVVMVDGSLKAGVQKTNKSYDSRSLGIISTKPGLVLGDDTPPEGKPVLLALNGRVPVKIASDSSPIHAGDLITSSNQPGKAMKATQAGATIGKALEDWSPDSGKQTIMAFVNLSSYDPDLELTDTGDLNIAADPEDMEGPFKLKDANGEDISRVGRFSQAAIANLSAGVVNAQKFLLNGVDIFDLIGKPTTPASSSALSENMQLKINNLDTRLGGVEQLASQSAADISFLKDAMQKGTFGVSSESAALQSVLGTLDIKDATVSGTLNVLGRTTVNDLGVTGNFTAGVLAINGLDDDGQAAINTTAGDLKLQSTGAGGVDFLAGKITIDKKGNMHVKESITAKTVNTTKLNIIEDTESTTSAVLSTSAGSVVIEKGETSIEVNTKALTTKSLIFATPDQPVAVGTKSKDKDTFIIKLQQPLSADLKVNWWIVN